MNVDTYTDLSHTIHNHYANRRVPLEVSLEVTRRCPLECLHCYNNLPMGDLAARNRELSRDEHFKLLDELAELGCLWLLYTGGGSFLGEGFLYIFTPTERKRFLFYLFSQMTPKSGKNAEYHP